MTRVGVLSVVAGKFEPHVRPLCEARGLPVGFWKRSDAIPAEDGAAMDVLLADPDLAAEAVPRLPALRWVQSTWAGVDKLARSPAARAREGAMVVTGLPGVHATVIAEYVTCYVTAWQRNLFAHWDDQKARRWRFRTYEKLAGKTATVIGTGYIGRRVAAALAGLGLRPLGLSRSGRPCAPFEEVAPAADLPARDALLGRSDVVVAVLPWTPESDRLIDARWFQAMRPTTLFVNVGRGRTVDEPALIEALRSRRLRGAVLDVVTDEPLPDGSPLWGLDNVVITPHVAGITFADDIAAAFAANLDRYLRGEPLERPVDFAKGY